MPALLALAAVAAAVATPAPLALHPENPRYFLFRGKPTVLVTSAEHYGAVLNLDFDYVRYLDALAQDGLNLTRTFSGAYREAPGSFGITDNTLAPLAGRFVAPWARSTTPGESDGGTKFDLARWDEAYFRRLEGFVAEAAKRGIVVEVNLFCPFYEESMWAASPMNARNNVNGVGAVPREELYTLKHPDLTRVQEEMTRKIVRALNRFDNVYFEVANEPYFGGVTIEWQHHVAKVIAETEAALPNRHLVSMNVANGRARIESPSPHVSIFNFHYTYPPDVVEMNAHLRGVIGENETGFRGKADVLYRTEGWAFLLAGGGLYNNLDYSFTARHPSGTFLDYTSPGGGSPTLRRQVRVLKDFVHSFDFVRMAPRRQDVKAPEGVSVEALVEPGKQLAAYFYRPVATGFSARWTGGLLAPVCGTYRLTTVSDDGVRLWLDGRLVVDNWSDHGPTEDHASLEVTSGGPVDLRLEYYQGAGGAVARLLWKTPGGSSGVVPESSLQLPDGRGSGLRGEYFRGRGFDEPPALVRTDATVDFEWPAGTGPIPEAAPLAGPMDVAVELPAGRYRAEWLDPGTGAVLETAAFEHAGGRRTLVSPALGEDLALSVRAE